jgi:hypothetical protein
VTSTAPTAVPTAGTLTVSQNSSKNAEIACNDGSLTLSGWSDTYVVTGHCVSLTVPGDSMNVTIDKADTIALSGRSNTVVDSVCNNGTINLSDQSKDNVIRVHGHCAGLTVSGWRNNVAVENADTITVSGDKNKVTYLSGAPKITDGTRHHLRREQLTDGRSHRHSPPPRGSAFYSDAKSKGAQCLTGPADPMAEIRCYLPDPDGYLIEIGQAIGVLHGASADRSARDVP